jgi:hypothetical protein
MDERDQKKTPTPEMDIATPGLGCWELCCQQLVKPAWLREFNVGSLRRFQLRSPL